MLFELSKQALGDQCPSEALTEMTSLSRLPPDAAGTSKKVDILLALWLQRLPDPVCAANANFSYFTHDDTAARADSFLDAHKATTRPPIYAATLSGPLDEVELPSSPLDDTQLHRRCASLHTPTGPAPGPRPKNFALAHRRTPPPPPSGGMISLQNFVITTLVLGILPKNVKNHVHGHKMSCEVAA